jgi:hypothetical protein
MVEYEHPDHAKNGDRDGDHQRPNRPATVYRSYGCRLAHAEQTSLTPVKFRLPQGWID